MRRAAVLLVVLLLAGCGVPEDAVPRPLDPQEAPFSRPDPVADPVGPGRVALYFVRDGRAALTIRPVQRSQPLPDLLELLLAGPTPDELAAGTSTLIPASITVEDVSVTGGIGVVTLGGPEDQVKTAPPLAFAQLVATLTTPGRLDGVRFRLGDADLDVPRGDSSLSQQPLDQDDYEELMVVPTPSASASAS